MKPGPKPIPVEIRFWKFVKKTESCWTWQGATAGSGYGHINIQARPRTILMSAHRLSWEIHNGKIKKEQHVLHRCDVPLCVNPSHLFIGTQRDNMRDMNKKGRSFHKKGEETKAAKLTNAIIFKIRKYYQKGLHGFGYGSTAKKFRIAQTTVWLIINQKTWKHI